MAPYLIKSLGYLTGVQMYTFITLRNRHKHPSIHAHTIMPQPPPPHTHTCIEAHCRDSYSESWRRNAQTEFVEVPNPTLYRPFLFPCIFFVFAVNTGFDVPLTCATFWFIWKLKVFFIHVLPAIARLLTKTVVLPPVPRKPNRNPRAHGHQKRKVSSVCRLWACCVS